MDFSPTLPALADFGALPPVARGVAGALDDSDTV